MTVRTSHHDIVVVGGGLVGAAIAYGLCDGARDVGLLDEGDVALRASRGNFGLVWVQSKGLGLPAYGGWTLDSANAWPRLARALADETGVDVRLEQPGGIGVLLSDAEVERRVDEMRRMLAQPGMPAYEWELLDPPALRERVPGIGPAVRAGLYCRHDGHVNPLKLLRALHASLRQRGAHVRPGHAVERIEPLARGFRLHTPHGAVTASRVVLASGLGNARLAPMVGLVAPVRPQRGQVLVLERMRPFLRYPITTLRQTDEGTVLVGDSQEESGPSDAVGLPVLASLAERALLTFPALRDARVVRTWAALRVMSTDGFPVYDESPRYPGAFLATCHSGVTLAAAHAHLLAPAIAAGTLPEAVRAFSAARFDVPAAA
jgi:glycine/D-amino acid oxidase-like deaminating enzyme